MKFTKMHGAGNDYIYVDCTQSVIDNPSQVAIDLSDRHFWNRFGWTYSY